MTTKYKIVFMVELLNEYYRNLQCRDFNIIPSPETQLLLRNQRMLFKAIGNKLVVLAKVKTETAGADEDKPFVDIGNDKKFLFYLDLIRTEFATVTNLDTDSLKAKKRFYFSNLSGNASGTELHLSTKLNNYLAASSYQPGDIAINAGVVVECIKSATGVFNTNSWHQRTGLQYVTSADMLPFVTRVETYEATVAAKVFTIKLFGLNTASNLYTLEIPLEKNSFKSPEDTKQVPVDLTGISPGRYKLQINTDVFDVFVDDTAVHSRFFAAIEIFTHLAPGVDFALLDTQGKVKDKIIAGNVQWLKYQVRFANRLAYWKYLTPRHGVSSIDAAPSFVFDPTPASGNKDFFTSTKPVPLLESPWSFKLALTSVTSAEPPLAPNPDPTVTGMLSRTEPGKEYFCTINLNY